ncbi:DUF2501 domain-containing protein [Dyella sp.]|jgi:Protein of unknown function (DUF2501)|uniref:DUF2501 domain-containing protein n=1 Tax=Dyella sp. TaxID=1869338 RepID=UPI002BB914EE|nr:DUF2501 domain-containing protein [Dyella sp.]HTC27081.1 DUF2501 domain-containing protein [Dyella sp.]
MKMRLSNVAASGVALVFCLACSAGYAQDMGGLGNKLGGMMPGSSMQSGSMGNVAGLLQYCVKNNYLGGASGASGIQNQLLGKMQGQSSAPPTNDPGYMSGAKGILQGGNGKTMDLSSVGGGSSDMKSKITTKVCDSVLKQGKSFAGM